MNEWKRTDRGIERVFGVPFSKVDIKESAFDKISGYVTVACTCAFIIGLLTSEIWLF